MRDLIALAAKGKLLDEQTAREALGNGPTSVRELCRRTKTVTHNSIASRVRTSH